MKPLDQMVFNLFQIVPTKPKLCPVSRLRSGPVKSADLEAHDIEIIAVYLNVHESLKHKIACFSFL